MRQGRQNDRKAAMKEEQPAETEGVGGEGRERGSEGSAEGRDAGKSSWRSVVDPAIR